MKTAATVKSGGCQGKEGQQLLPVLFTTIVLVFSGCLNLKPAIDATRFFVLSPLSIAKTAPSAPVEGLAVGIGRVEVPDYLQPKRIAVRKSGAEVEYSEALQWAERLDKGIQRAIGANIGALLGSANVALSSWRRGDVQTEVYVSVQRFESDSNGRVGLEARWRIIDPGGATTRRAGRSGITKQGPTFSSNPDGAVATLSEALGDLSREIAAALRDSSPSQSHP